MPNEYSESFWCHNCGWRGPNTELKPIEDIFERVEPGERMPAGQCPLCDALCHKVEAPQRLKSGHHTDTGRGVCAQCGAAIVDKGNTNEK